MADWDCHVELDGHVVRELLREQFPALADAPVAYLKEGWDSRAYEIGGRWIFRFPKRADVASQQAREQALLRERSTADCLSLSLVTSCTDARSGALPVRLRGVREARGPAGARLTPTTSRRRLSRIWRRS